MAAMILGQDVLPKPDQMPAFDTKILLAAMAIHVPLSVAYGVIGLSYALLRKSGPARATAA